MISESLFETAWSAFQRPLRRPSGDELLDQRAALRNAIEAIAAALESNAILPVASSSAILFLDSRAFDLESLRDLCLERPQGVLLVPTLPRSGQTVADCVAAQTPEQLEQLLALAAGERRA